MISMKTKIFYKTGNFNDWHLPILKNKNSKTHLLVDGFPHSITDYEEPLYPIKDFKIFDDFIEFLKEFSIEELQNFNYNSKNEIQSALNELQKRKNKVKSNSQIEKYIKAEMKILRQVVKFI